jgi:hypothetical protein
VREHLEVVFTKFNNAPEFWHIATGQKKKGDIFPNLTGDLSGGSYFAAITINQYFHHLARMAGGSLSVSPLKPVQSPRYLTG